MVIFIATDQSPVIVVHGQVGLMAVLGRIERTASPKASGHSSPAGKRGHPPASILSRGIPRKCAT